MDQNLREQQLSTLRRLKELREELAALVAANVILELQIKKETVAEKPIKDNYKKQTEAAKEQELNNLPKTISGGKTALLAIVIYLVFAVGIQLVIGYSDAAMLISFAASIVASVGIYLSLKIARKSGTKKILAKYEQHLINAAEYDRQAELKYASDLANAESIARAKYTPEINANKEKMKPITAEQAKLNMLSKSEEKHLDRIIQVMERGGADSIEGALAFIKEEIRKEEEENRRIAAEKRRIEEDERRREQARRATMPGTVHVTVGSINTYSGNLQTVRNEVYIDGQMYGTSSAYGTTFDLNPGPHTIYAKMLEAGYLFTSPSRSFVLEGDGYVDVKIKLDHGNVYVTVT